jgi:hypothetical protein
MKLYSCPRCSAKIFFENLTCLACNSELGYVPAANSMQLLTDQTAVAAGPVDTGQWLACGNRRNEVACNWLVAPHAGASEAVAKLCDCCRYTITIPPLDDAANRHAWHRLEYAKRYLFYSLWQLNLPRPDRLEQPETGLAFEFLTQLPQQSKVLTGHANGVITVNIAEADDVMREQRRVSLHEPSRTLLGHLRHEIGYFYWDQLIAGSAQPGGQLEKFRSVFGDERDDYAAALQRHYEGTNAYSWQTNFISHYASAHPWEDWAETWAHYLRISDALDTAAAWGIDMQLDTTQIVTTGISKDASVAQFKDALIKEWLPLSQYLNATCRSLGEADAYPFILSPPAVEKLAFVHAVIAGA